MDRGTDAAAVLRNEAVPLRLGYVGVVNRSQHDLNTGTAMAAARAAEAHFFASKPEYHDVSPPPPPSPPSPPPLPQIWRLSAALPLTPAASVANHLLTAVVVRSLLQLLYSRY